MVECGVSYFGVRRLKLARQDLDDMARHGATYVVHMLSELDWSYYYETMREIVRTTHQAGLKAWIDPWGLGYVFAGDCDSPYVAAHPEVSQIDQLGKVLPGACPNRPEFMAFAKRWTDAALDLGADMLFWDEPHLYLPEWFQQSGRWGCRCPTCRSLYKERFGEDMPTSEEDAGVMAFKAETLMNFLRELLSYAKRQGARNAITVLPENYQKKGLLDWQAIASLDCVDNLGTDPYPFPSYANQLNFGDHWREYVLEYTDRIVKLTEEHHLENHLWVEGFSLPNDDFGYLDQVMDLAMDRGIQNLAVWGFDGHRDMSAFACENPDKVWQQIGEGFRRVRTGQHGTKLV